MCINEWHLKLRYDLRMKGGVRTNDFLTLLHIEQTSLCKGDINVRTFMEKLNEARSSKYQCTQKRKTERCTNRR